MRGLTARVRAGAMNGLTGRVMPTAEKIVEEMYTWYNDRTDEGSLDEVFRNLHSALFKHVKVPLKDDLWKHPDLGGASQPAAQGETEVPEAHLSSAKSTLLVRLRL